jgi:CRP-like cAMP-binding protein
VDGAAKWEVGLERAIGLGLQRVAFVGGDTVIREGEAAVAMYVISSGEVEVWKALKTDGPLTRLGEGAFFGEIALLSENRRAVA